MKKLSLLIALIILMCANCLPASAQNGTKEERHTYLWDVTLSMFGQRKGYSQYDIYDEVVEKMTSNINAIQNEQTEIVVIPFQEKHLEVWRTYATKQGKQDIISRIKHYKNENVTGTNITEPLQYAISHVFTEDRIDIVKLLTDGVPNRDTEALFRLLNGWCDMAEKKDVYGYYVMLTPDATSQELKRLLEQQCRFEVVVSLDFDKIFQVNGVQSAVINLKDDYGKPKQLPFTVYGNSTTVPPAYRIRFKSEDNPYIRIDESCALDSENRITLHPQYLMPQAELHRLMPEISTMTVSMTADADMSKECEFVRLAQSEFTISVVNRPEKAVEIWVKDEGRKANTRRNGINIGKIGQYDDLWFVHYTPDTLHTTLCFEFNEDAKELLRQPVRLQFAYRDESDRLCTLTPDVAQLYLNGMPLQDNIIAVDNQTEEADLGLVFNTKADNRTYNLHLRPASAAGDIDRINGTETSAYDDNTKILTLRAKKTHVMNPLAVALLWIGIILLALLLLWLLVLKTVFFPVFHISHVNLTGPEPYMSMLYVRGARQLVLTGRQRKQNFMSRLFTGKIIYEVNPLWASEVTIMPVDRKSVRFSPLKKTDYLIESTRLQSNQDYTIENIASRSKTTIRVY